jgi:hypothetical protein
MFTLGEPGSEGMSRAPTAVQSPKVDPQREEQMSTQADYGRRSGWITFAAILMFAVGFARIIAAFTYFDDSNDVNDLTRSIFGDNLWAAGVWDLAIAALALFAGWSLLGGGGFGKVIAYIWAVFVIVQSFLIIGAAPWYAIAMILIAVAVIHALATSGEEP